MARKFSVATAAGTFDHFHKGHEQFLKAAFNLADTIHIGITSDQFGKAKRQVDDLASFSNRERDVEAFLKSNGLLKRAHIVELHDIYGPTLDPACDIEAIIVTEQTRYGADLINRLRTQKGLPPLAIEQVAYIKAADAGDLSSSRIRAGEIDRQGEPWINIEWLTKTLTLPDAIRPMLQRPIGILIRGSEEDLSKATEVIKHKLVHPRGVLILTPQGWRPTIVTVGDVVTKSFNEAKLLMDVAIVDFQVKRVETFKNISEIGFAKNEPDIVVENPKGNLTPEAFSAVEESFRKGGTLSKVPPYIIRVIGEEDLVTLAVVLAAPLGTHVFYGQPHEGIVQVIVTESKKSEVRDIVSAFT